MNEIVRFDKGRQDRIVTDAFMRPLSVVFKHQADEDKSTEEMVAAYIEELGRFPEEVLKEAARLFKTSRKVIWFPSIAECVGTCERVAVRLVNERKPRAQKAEKTPCREIDAAIFNGARPSVVMKDRKSWPEDGGTWAVMNGPWRGEDPERPYFIIPDWWEDHIDWEKTDPRLRPTY